jgi:uncharacterized protein YdeI (YjbR/CyaY-like superfamily)
VLTFNSRDEWRSWLSSHYDLVSEAWLVLYKKGLRQTRQISLSLSEAQEEALCFGWIDHLSKTLDSSRFMLRFTPRRAGSISQLGVFMDPATCTAELDVLITRSMAAT